MSVYRRDYANEIDRAAHSDGIWAYAFTYRKYRYRRSGFLTKREAEFAEAKAREEAMFQGKLPSAGSDIGFSTLMDQFMSGRHLIRAARTVAGEMQKAKVLKRYFKNSPLSRIGVAKIEKYRDFRVARGKNPRTFNLELILLRCLFKYANKHGFAQTNPAKEVAELTVPKKDKPIPSDQELQKLLEEAEKTPSGRQLVVWIWLSAFTGLRPSESAFLEWADVDFGRSVLFVRPKEGNPLKTGKWRPVEIHPHLLTILGKWKVEWDEVFSKREQGKEHDWVFFNPRKPGWRCDTFRKSFEQACRAATLTGITMYSMRHYFISKAIMSGIDIFTVAKWAGHSSTKMIYDVYGHLSPKYRQEQMAKFDAGISPNGTNEKKSA